MNLIAEADRILRGLGAVLIAYGILPRQETCEHDRLARRAAFETNCNSVISLLSLLRSNYIYGSAKAALNVFLEGLYMRLRQANVSVLTIKPGLVRRPKKRRNHDLSRREIEETFDLCPLVLALRHVNSSMKVTVPEVGLPIDHRRVLLQTDFFARIAG